METFDVIIIGAGPAGLNCAKILAESKLKVLLLEKNKVIGPKVCAGGLTQKSVDYLNLPKSLVGNDFKNVLLHTPLLTSTLKFSKPFVYTVDRKELGQWQLRQLRKYKNITIKTCALVNKIENNRVILSNKQKYKFKYLVGADGSSSFVRKHLGISTDNIGMAVQYVVPTKKYQEMEFFYEPKLFKAWYTWIFPHKNFVSIGCGSDPKYLNTSNLRAYFKIWLDRNHIDVSKAKFEAFPISCDYKGYKFGNVFLIGDAAGLASSFSGEGIYQALLSGEEVAKLILDKNYIPNLKEILKMNKRGNRIVKVLEFSGVFMSFLLYLIALSLRSKFIADKILKKLL
jgi:geranylgeranyl reductase family protein